jgi:hypothetical protein
MGWRRSLEPAADRAPLSCAPDYCEPVSAWRMWEVGDLDTAPRLRSLYRNCVWPVGVPFEARCEAHRFRPWRRERHCAPSTTCTCGIYAVSYEFIRRLALHDRLPAERPFVIGAVSLWGNVIECERGWRAALAYPARLFVPDACTEAEQHAVGLADYGVPVELLGTLNVTDALDAVAELAA